MAKQNDFASNLRQTNDKMTDIQWRSMRDNLIFTGIEEPPLSDEAEDTEATLRRFLSNEMNITDPIPFDRVHRLGKQRDSHPGHQLKPRPIIAKFERYKDKERVRLAAPRSLTGTVFGVRDQYPAEMEQKRRALYPVMRQYKQNPRNKVRLVRDKLYINDTEYIPKEESEIDNTARGKTNTNIQRQRQSTIFPSRQFNNSKRYNTSKQQNLRKDNQRSYSDALQNNSHTDKHYNSAIQTSNRFNFSDEDDMDVAFDQDTRTGSKRHATSPLDSTAKESRLKSPTQNNDGACGSPYLTNNDERFENQSKEAPKAPPSNGNLPVNVISHTSSQIEINPSILSTTRNPVGPVTEPTIYIDSMTSNGSPVSGGNTCEWNSDKTGSAH